MVEDSSPIQFEEFDKLNPLVIDRLNIGRKNSA